MNKPTILVVEDDSSVRSLITTTLKAHGYKFLTAANGEMAVMMASSHNPDIMLLDLGLPDIDGVEVIRRIREWSNLPIIVLSARSEDSDKIEALDQGADDYLTKPFSVDELLARLRVTQRRLNLQASGEVSSSVFVNGPLKIDFAAGCVWLNDEELHLTPIEYSCAQCRKGSDPYGDYAKSLGKLARKRHCIPACLHGIFAQKAGIRRTFSASGSDPCGGRLPDAAC